MVRHPGLVAFTFALAFTFVPPAEAGVLIVDAAGSGNFTNLPSAVSVAQDGDTILVRPGTYSGFSLTGKGLSILGAATQVHVGHVRLSNIPASSAVVLSGLSILAPDYHDAPRRSGILIQDVDAAVRIQNCSMEGAKLPPDLQFGGAGSIGAEVVRSENVVFVRCTMLGGRGDDWWVSVAAGDPGGVALNCVDSRVLVHESLAIGGPGGDGDGGGVGGAGMRAKGALQVLVAIGSQSVGGDGGDDLSSVPIFGGGVGGAGLALQSGAKARIRSCQFVGGTGGKWAGGLPGVDGLPILAESGTSLVQLPGAARELALAPSGYAGGKLSAWVTGEPGDGIWLVVHGSTSWGYVAPLSGVWTLPIPFLRPLVPLGVVPASGVMQLTLDLPLLPPGQPDMRRFVQGLAVNVAGKAFTMTPNVLVSVHCAFSVDCNNNNHPDGCEVITGQAPDCNGNNVPDSCDIASFASVDLNLDGIPDECQ